VLITLPNTSENSQFGVSAGKSIGSAVQRNRAKRLIREALRPLFPRIKTGWDLVFLSRHPLVNANLVEIQKAILTLLIRADLLEE
jgi:ribonuclease P protein component